MKLSIYIYTILCLLVFSCQKSNKTTNGNFQSFEDLKSIEVDSALINTPVGLQEIFSIVDGDHLVFHYHENNEDEIEESCFDCATALDVYFQIDSELTSFHLKDESLIASQTHFVNLFGLGSFNGRVVDGEIIGTKTTANSWHIDFKIKVGFDAFETRSATYVLD